MIVLKTFQVDSPGTVQISTLLDILALDILGLDILGLDILGLDILGRFHSLELVNQQRTCKPHGIADITASKG